MTPKYLLKFIQNLRRLIPGGLVALLFAAPALLFVDFGSLRQEPARPSSTQGGERARGSPQVEIDPFSQQGIFAIGERDAQRASWSWEEAKTLSALVWEDQIPGVGIYESFYCGCSIERRGTSGGTLDLASCGYEPRSSEVRASRLEWEHVVPAAFIAKGLSCWTQGAPVCTDDLGNAFKGRSCCLLADPAFALAAFDPVNLVPSSGEINSDRLDYPFAEIPGEDRVYGRCDMEIDRRRGLAEPPSQRRGDIARIWAYMSRAYGLKIPREQADLYQSWIGLDPVSAEELRINRAIAREGHRPNPFVIGQARN